MNSIGTRGRCLLVAVAVTAAAAVGTWTLLPFLTATPTRVDGQLVRLCAVLLLGCGCWAWLACLAAVADAWRGAVGGDLHGVPASLRRLVLGACGVTLAVGLAAPASAAGPSSVDLTLAGLPLPDRATAAEPPTPAPAAPLPRGVHVVVPGDSLFSIAAATLPEDAPPEAVAVRWRAIHALNRAVIGADPDLIHPGQRLALPPRDSPPTPTSPPLPDPAGGPQ